LLAARTKTKKNQNNKNKTRKRSVVVQTVPLTFRGPFFVLVSHFLDQKEKVLDRKNEYKFKKPKNLNTGKA